MIAIDIETEPFSPHIKIRHQFGAPPLVCAAFAYEDGRVSWAYKMEHLWPLFMDALHSRQALVFHNAKYDLRSIAAEWGPAMRTALEEAIHSGRILDTLVMYWLRNPDSNVSKDLKSVYQEVCGKVLNKGEISNSFRRGVEPTAEQILYNKADARATLEVALALQKMPYGQLARRGVEFEIKAHAGYYDGQRPDVLYSQASALLAFYLEPTGLAVNRHTLEDLHAKTCQEVVQFYRKLDTAGLADLRRLPKCPTRPCTVPGTWSSRRWVRASVDPPLLARRGARGPEEVDAAWKLNDRRLRDAFAAEGVRLGVRPPVSDTGLTSLDYDFWSTYRLDLPAPLQDYLGLSKARKCLSAFLDPLWVSGAEHVYPQYFIPGAETGRWACSAPNIQQLPKALRKIFGSQMSGADYKALECYTLAHSMASLGIRGPFMDALNTADPHTLVASKLGCTRQQAKVATFGLGGGMGKRRFFEYMRYQCGIDVTMDQSSALRQGWLDLFWDVAQYLQLFQKNFYELCPAGEGRAAWLEGLGFDLDETWPSSYAISQRLGGGFTVTLPSGRCVPRRGYSQAANMFFQGTGADVMTTAFVRLCERRAPVAAVVHDSAYVLGSDPPLGVSMEVALQTVCPSLNRIPRPEVVECGTFF